MHVIRKYNTRYNISPLCTNARVPYVRAVQTHLEDQGRLALVAGARSELQPALVLPDADSHDATTKL